MGTKRQSLVSRRLPTRMKGLRRSRPQTAPGTATPVRACEATLRAATGQECGNTLAIATQS